MSTKCCAAATKSTAVGHLQKCCACSALRPRQSVTLATNFDMSKNASCARLFQNFKIDGSCVSLRLLWWGFYFCCAPPPFRLPPPVSFQLTQNTSHTHQLDSLNSRVHFHLHSISYTPWPLNSHQLIPHLHLLEVLMRRCLGPPRLLPLRFHALRAHS